MNKVENKVTKITKKVEPKSTNSLEQEIGFVQWLAAKKKVESIPANGLKKDPVARAKAQAELEKIEAEILK